MYKSLASSFFKIVICFTAFTVLVNAQSNPSSKKGFVKLFNGKNFDGWYLKIKSGDAELAKKVYAIEKGVIHVYNENFPAEYELNTGANKTHGLFYTTKSYSKFILRFEYKWGTKKANNFDQWQYDAGCYYHVVNDKIWPTGIEYQIRYNHLTQKNHTADFWVSGFNLDWTANSEGKSFLAANEGGILFEKKKGELHASPNPKFNALNNKWNQCEIIVMGNEYTIHKLNGKIVNMGRNLTVGEGKIGFQSETAEIFYRNIEIKEFQEVIPIEKFITQ